MPVQRKLMEIRFVERDMSFFQLGKIEPYMYALSLETFKFNGEFLNTGIDEIDFIADDTALSTNFTLDANTLSETSFIRGDIAYQGADLTSNTARGIVVMFDRPSGTLRLRNIKGAFVRGNTIIGSTSGATGELVDYDLLQTATEGEIVDNRIIENEAEEYLDFSESNPFGEP